MQYTTLNKILNLIEEACVQHAQVASFLFGEDSEISTQQELYPLVVANIAPATISDKTLVLPMVIQVLDIQRTNEDNIRDTFSDCLSIAQDLYAMMSNPDNEDYFLIQQNVSLEPVREAYPDIVNGWRMTLNFELAQTRDRCSVPSK